MNNIYLAINVYGSSKVLKNLWVLDFNKKIKYFGINPIINRNDYITIEEEKDKLWNFFIPINDKNILDKILYSDFNKLQEISINEILKQFNLIEWVI
jgi:hypothetical protein